MLLENKHILIVSNEAWGPLWFSKHNYAWELSEKNKVYFLNPPKPFSVLNIFRENITAETITPALKVITYKNILPVKIEWMRRVNENYILGKLRNYLKKEKAEKLLFWTFDPIRLSSPEKLGPQKIVLHAVDQYLFTYPSEKILAPKADIIFCVSESILKAYKPYNKNVHLIPHVIPDDEFLPPAPTGNSMLTGIFAGSLDARIDYSYTEYIISKFPEVKFRFIGKINIKNDFTDKLAGGYFKNAVFEGPKPFKEIKYEIRKADFCFLFKDNTVPGNNISSHKMLQYFAQGKPIFSSELSQHDEVAELICMENDKEKMTAYISEFIKHGDDPEKIKLRIAYAQRHAFSSTLKKIETLLGKDE